LRDQPLQQRRAAAPEKAQIEILIARVEERLRTHPEDGQGWEVIAPVYGRLGRDREALDAWRQAIKLLGPGTARLRGLAEASIGLGQGTIDAEARGALETLRATNPDDPIPQFWLAMAKQQDGRRDEAAADLEALLAKAPADAPWRVAIGERLAEMKAAARPDAALPASGPPATGPSILGPPAPGLPAPGPSSEQMAAAQQMSSEDRARMISGMVDGLADRLARNGADAEGWMRLINAYMVLGRKTDATAALASARKALAGDTTALSRLAELAHDLGL
jgi:cytochrome c-type biogenesis protein CcmH